MHRVAHTVTYICNREYIVESFRNHQLTYVARKGRARAFVGAAFSVVFAVGNPVVIRAEVELVFACRHHTFAKVMLHHQSVDCVQLANQLFVQMRAVRVAHRAYQL